MELDELTPAQRAKVEAATTRFGCTEDFQVTRQFDLPRDWVLVTMGEAKGRPFVFTVGPGGETRT